MRRAFSIAILFLLAVFVAADYTDMNDKLEAGETVALENGMVVQPGSGVTINPGGSVDCASTCTIGGTTFSSVQGLRDRGGGKFDAEKFQNDFGTFEGAQNCDKKGCDFVKRFTTPDGQVINNAVGLSLEGDTVSVDSADSFDCNGYSGVNVQGASCSPGSIKFDSADTVSWGDNLASGVTGFESSGSTTNFDSADMFNTDGRTFNNLGESSFDYDGDKLVQADITGGEDDSSQTISEEDGQVTSITLDDGEAVSITFNEDGTFEHESTESADFKEFMDQWQQDQVGEDFDIGAAIDEGQEMYPDEGIIENCPCSRCPGLDWCVALSDPTNDPEYFDADEIIDSIPDPETLPEDQNPEPLNPNGETATTQQFDKWSTENGDDLDMLYEESLKYPEWEDNNPDKPISECPCSECPNLAWCQADVDQRVDEALEEFFGDIEDGVVEEGDEPFVNPDLNIITADAITFQTENDFIQSDGGMLQILMDEESGLVTYVLLDAGSRYENHDLNVFKDPYAVYANPGHDLKLEIVRYDNQPRVLDPDTCYQCMIVDYTDNTVSLNGVGEFEFDNNQLRAGDISFFTDVVESRTVDNKIRMQFDLDMDYAEDVTFEGSDGLFLSGKFQNLKTDGEDSYAWNLNPGTPWAIRSITPEIYIDPDGSLIRINEDNTFSMYAADTDAYEEFKEKYEEISS